MIRVFGSPFCCVVCRILELRSARRLVVSPRRWIRPIVVPNLQRKTHQIRRPFRLGRRWNHRYVNDCLTSSDITYGRLRDFTDYHWSLFSCQVNLKPSLTQRRPITRLSRTYQHAPKLLNVDALMNWSIRARKRGENRLKPPPDEWWRKSVAMLMINWRFHVIQLVWGIGLMAACLIGSLYFSSTGSTSNIEGF